jgi:hypothetical protein
MMTVTRMFQKMIYFLLRMISYKAQTRKTNVESALRRSHKLEAPACIESSDV